MADVILSEDLVELGITETEKEAAIKVLADKMMAKGLVKDGYYENVVKREEVFPTGLPTVIPVALCHTEAKYVNQSAMAVGTLTQPVAFHEMGAPERDIRAEIIFLLALKDPKDQISYLKEMVTVFKSKEILEAIRDATDKKALIALLKEFF
ncbi:MAG: PTS sugar transporter subunit IIA [Chloroflexota bacterium]|nr:PTS sugar transporter subunit IIA [Chloroflexota bacterium]